MFFEGRAEPLSYVRGSERAIGTPVRNAGSGRASSGRGFGTPSRFGMRLGLSESGQGGPGAQQIRAVGDGLA